MVLYLPYGYEYIIFTIQIKYRLKRFLHILRRFFLIILAFLLLAFIAIQTDFVQNWLIGMATNKLSTALGTEVSIKSVSFSLFNKFNLEGTLVKDKNKDTILYSGKLKV